jgi:hypothetical protein
MNRELLFRRLNNALLDMQASTSQTFEQHFLTFARLAADPSLEALNDDLTASLDLERFLEASEKNQGSMTGSAKLLWPADADQVLGLKWLLIQKFAREPRLILNFAHTFYTAGRSLTGELHSLTRQLLIPFGRDYKEYVMSIAEPNVDKPGEQGNDSRSDHAPHIVTYNMTGPNARVNNHSSDSSINTLTIVGAEVIEHLQALRSEIHRADLTSEQRTEAVEVVNEIQEQVESGKPKKSIVGALIKSLPAVQSITAIGKALYDVLHSSGHI